MNGAHRWVPSGNSGVTGYRRYTEERFNNREIGRNEQRYRQEGGDLGMEVGRIRQNGEREVIELTGEGGVGTTHRREQAYKERKLKRV